MTSGKRSAETFLTRNKCITCPGLWQGKDPIILKNKTHPHTRIHHSPIRHVQVRGLMIHTFSSQLSVRYCSVKFILTTWNVMRHTRCLCQLQKPDRGVCHTLLLWNYINMMELICGFRTVSANKTRHRVMNLLDKSIKLVSVSVFCAAALSCTSVWLLGSPRFLILPKNC